MWFGWVWTEANDVMVFFFYRLICMINREEHYFVDIVVVLEWSSASYELSYYKLLPSHMSATKPE